MRVQVLSDLHFEFQHDGGEAFAASCHAPEAHVLVLAGDIAVGAGLLQALGLFSERYPHVVYVHGNHEFYGSDRAEVLDFTRRACRRHGNVHWLDCGQVELDGVRFLGAPLWFPATAETQRYRAQLNDFAQIRDYEQWVHAEHERARGYFEREIRSGDVVVSHHLPSPVSVLPQYRGHPLNCYFVADMSHVLEQQGPALWIHGHTHGSVDARVGHTRIVCNPFGYARIEENPTFQPKLVIELSGA